MSENNRESAKQEEKVKASSDSNTNEAGVDNAGDIEDDRSVTSEKHARHKKTTKNTKKVTSVAGKQSVSGERNKDQMSIEKSSGEQSNKKRKHHDKSSATQKGSNKAAPESATGSHLIQPNKKKKSKKAAPVATSPRRQSSRTSGRNCPTCLESIHGEYDADSVCWGCKKELHARPGCRTRHFVTLDRKNKRTRVFCCNDNVCLNRAFECRPSDDETSDD